MEKMLYDIDGFEQIKPNNDAVCNWKKKEKKRSKMNKIKNSIIARQSTIVHWFN